MDRPALTTQHRILQLLLTKYEHIQSDFSNHLSCKLYGIPRSFKKVVLLLGKEMIFMFGKEQISVFYDHLNFFQVAASEIAISGIYLYGGRGWLFQLSLCCFPNENSFQVTFTLLENMPSTHKIGGSNFQWKNCFVVHGVAEVFTSPLSSCWRSRGQVYQTSSRTNQDCEFNIPHFSP